MGTIKTKGIVIKIADSSENDRVLTVLTADLGKIKVFCKGAKKSKSAFLSSTEFLAFSEMMLFEGTSDLYRLSSAETIEVFYNLRMDIEKLIVATTIAQMINDVSQDGEMCYQKLQLLLNTLYILSETGKNIHLVFATFELRLLAILGFTPRLSKCVSCEKKMETEKLFYFSIKDNGIKCNICAKQDTAAIQINETTYATLCYIFSCEAKKLYAYEIPLAVINELKLIAKIYTTEKLEKEYKMCQWDGING